MIPGARPAWVEISAENSHFKAGATTVSLGTHSNMDLGVADVADPNITVSQVVVGSPTNLRVQLTMTPQVLIGPHDLTVTTAGALPGGVNEVLTLQGGLTIQQTLQASLPTGTTLPPQVGQGGLVNALFLNLDYSANPFNVNALSPLSGIASLFGIDAGAAPTPTLTTTTYGSLVLVDALAPVGGLGVALSTQSPINQPIAYVSNPMDPDAPIITLNAPMVLNEGSSLGNQLLAAPTTAIPYPTVLYKYTSPANNYVATLNLSNLGTGLLGGGVGAPPRVLGSQGPASGHFAAGLPIDTSPTIIMAALTARNVALYLPTAGDQYVDLYTENLSGSAQHTYTLLLKSAPGMNQSFKEPATPDSPTNPLASITLNMPYYGTDGAIDFVNDSDYIRIAPAVTGRVYASVTTNTGATLGLGLYAMDCVTTLGAATLRNAQGAVSQEEAVATGNSYCVRVTGPTVTPYQLVITQDLP
jgi:hypothetical protein